MNKVEKFIDARGKNLITFRKQMMSSNSLSKVKEQWKVYEGLIFPVGFLIKFSVKFTDISPVITISSLNLLGKAIFMKFNAQVCKMKSYNYIYQLA